MTLDQLRAFLHVADLGSQSEAAARLHVTQSALSRRLAQLEEGLGVSLFERRARGLTLTRAGERLRRRAAPLVEELDLTAAELRGAGRELDGEVRLAVPPSVGAQLACDVVEQIHAAHPRVRMHVEVSLSGGVRDRLLQGALDLGILYHPTESTQLHTELLYREELTLVSAAGAGDDACSLRDALGLPLVLPARRHGLRALVELHALRLGRELNVVVEADSLRLLVELVRRGVGHTLLPPSAIAEELAAGALGTRRIRRGALRRETLLAWPRDGGLSPSAIAVAEAIREWTRAHRGRAR